MSIFGIFRGSSSESNAQQAANAKLQADILKSIKSHKVPDAIRDRLERARSGKLPWIATLTAAELAIARSHGFRPIAAVSATCWLHYGYSWTNGHAQGWKKALTRLSREAKAAGANAVLDVKMRTIPLNLNDSMDFTLVGTAVWVEGLPPSSEPIIATVPALEFVKLLDADVVPTGIAIGAHHEWITSNRNTTWLGNTEMRALSHLWERARRKAHNHLRENAKDQGNGVLAHLNFSQMFEAEQNDNRRYLARHIVVATTVDAQPGKPLPHDIKIVVDIHAGRTPLTGTARHHQSYGTSEREGAI
ncbi:MAG TPA: heavy metal-binding domain-containing protein [Rhizomicrobium sp.]|jgi:uncharacterized protein YbjQ (UPF0145 family)